MPKFSENDKITVDGANEINTITPLDPATATATDISNKVNEILTVLKEVIK